VIVATAALGQLDSGCDCLIVAGERPCRGQSRASGP